MSVCSEARAATPAMDFRPLLLVCVATTALASPDCATFTACDSCTAHNTWSGANCRFCTVDNKCHAQWSMCTPLTAITWPFALASCPTHVLWRRRQSVLDVEQNGPQAVPEHPTATAGIISSSEMVHSADPYSADSSSDESSADEHLKQRSAGLRASTAAPRGKEAPASPQRRVDAKAWAEAVSWLAAVTAAAAPCELEHEALRQWLMSGVVLCDLIDRVRPGCVAKPSASPMPFKQMENIGNYVEACRELGVPQQDLFVTVDLYEGKNLGAVVRNIHSLGRVAQALGFEGPALGARLAQRNERKFSALQLAQARAMPARWTNQGNSFAVSTPASPGGAPEAPETPEAPEAPEVYGSNAESAAEYTQSGMNMALLDEMCDAVFDT